MKNLQSKSGVTLVEVMIAIVLVAVAAAIIYTEMLLSYRILMRSRGRIEAQGMAFDYVWEAYNMPLSELQQKSTAQMESFPTPENSVFGTNGTIDLAFYPETDMPFTPDLIQWWDIEIKVWPSPPGVESQLQLGTNPLAHVVVQRYRGTR
ncbi:MAG: prepilin-type N-terminal cleavage/methylation domain-containing protein [Verrucomicrobia bacterium]|nr:prepilin-type N-terminal cleavage/methylation domain-containing protein [Verrucomicrobiota bacterium]